MQLTLLGTGFPGVDYKGFGPANLVSTSQSSILVDCGSGVTQRLKEAKASSADIDALFLTHLHSDHVVDLYQLIISSWHSYRTKSWRIFGPRGTKKFINKLMDTWKDERMLRIKYEQRSSIQAFNLKVTEFNEYGKIRIKDWMQFIFLHINFWEDQEQVAFLFLTKICMQIIYLTIQQKRYTNMM